MQTDSTSLRSCPDCGHSIPAEAPEGLCPKCLLSEAAATVPDPSSRGRGLSRISLEEVAAAFPQLEVLEPIGEGGMGVVFKARQPKLDRLVALKLLRVAEDERDGFADRFLTEARALAKLSHPHIVTVHDFGQVGEFYFLLMEYVDGINLRQAMDSGECGPEEALSIVPVVCEALQFAHDRGVLHRDIKPANILLEKSGTVKIADFGLAKFVGEGVVPSGLTLSEFTLGTPAYMAPEQLERPGQVDHRADIYSLGVVFYEMLTGELPLGRFRAPSERSPVDRRLDQVVLRTLEKEPGDRFQSAREMGTEVEHASHSGVAAPPHSGASSPGAETAPAPPIPHPPSASGASPTKGKRFCWLGLAGTALLVLSGLPIIFFLILAIIVGAGMGMIELLTITLGCLVFALVGTILGWSELLRVRRDGDRPGGLVFAWIASVPLPSIAVILAFVIVTGITLRFFAPAGLGMQRAVVVMPLIMAVVTGILTAGFLLIRARHWVGGSTAGRGSRALLVACIGAGALWVLLLAYSGVESRLQLLRSLQVEAGLPSSRPWAMTDGTTRPDPKKAA